MKRVFSILFLFFLTQTVFSQKKVSFEQAFQSSPTNITKPLPSITNWADDNTYIETRRKEGKVEHYQVNVINGLSSPLTMPAEKPSPTAASLGLKEEEKNITSSPDGKWVAFTRKNDLYIKEVAGGKEIRLTHDGSETIKNGYASWVYFEEILGRGSRYRAFWWSPDSKKIAYMRFNDSQVPTFPIYVIRDQHGYLENEHYPKAGDPNPEVKMGIADITTTKTTWADFNEKDDQYFGTPVWTPSSQLWVQWLNRDQTDLKVYEINQENGSKKMVYEEHQKTWVDLDQGDRFTFLPSGNSFIVRSDRSGWAHFYHYKMDGTLLTQLTDGDFTVGSLYKVDEKAKRIYFNARKENSARWDLYSIGMDGKKMTRHSFGDYSFNGMNISPSGKYFITTYSNIKTPHTMVVMDMKGKIIREIASAKGEAFNDYALPRKELVRVKSDDGLFDLPVLLIYPVNFDPNKKYPVLASIYGGPNAGRIMDTWNATGLETWWAQEGLFQVIFDNRSSGHFGKKGMNYIHRQMGKYEIEDYITCAKWLREKPFIDASRIGITGGSFGGYLTCMALTYGADVFTHGVANASVTDWKFYDTHYTERYMDRPQDNPEGYKLTSVMTYADKLKGELRIVHGTSDDNVHMQNSLVLINRLQDLRKKFEFMLYPGERHGIGANNPAKGLHNRYEAYTFFYEKLLGKPAPQGFWQQAKETQKAF